MPLTNQANRLTATERRAEAIVLRRQGQTLQQIADTLGVSYQTIQKDLAKYMKRLDEECMQNVAALRAEEFEQLQDASARLNHQIHQEGETGRILDLVKVSESKRRLYAMDVQPVKKAEVVHRKEIAVQLITTLRAELPAHIFGEVLNVLTRSNEFDYLGGDAEGLGPQRGAANQPQLRGHSIAESDPTASIESEIIHIDPEEAVDFVDSEG